MGDPIRLRKKYVTPPHPWEGQRIEEEGKLLKEFGLKNKTELWKAEAELRKYRRIARHLIGAHGEEAEKKRKILIGKLARLGLLLGTASVDDVLSLEVSDLLERRMQTIVYKKGVARSVKDARHLITHGHIVYRGARHTTPGTFVPKSEEGNISYVGPKRFKPPSDSKEVPMIVESPPEAVEKPADIQEVE